MRPRLYFVVPGRGRHYGSTVLRGSQLCNSARRYLADRYDCALMPMPVLRKQRRGAVSVAFQRFWAATRPRGALYFVTKQCVERLDPTAAETLQSRARGVLFDYVDADMASVSMRGADIHLCASHAQFTHVSDRLRPGDTAVPALLLHGYDTRLEGQRLAPDRPLRAGYFGHPDNTFIPPGLTGRIPVFDASSSERMAEALAQMSACNLHYCVRPAPVDVGTTVFKPFTKGATAAACGANVLVNSAVHDAVAFLGEDYPYLAPSMDEAAISQRFAAAEDGIGGPDWHAGLAVMAEIAAQLSPDRICAQLDTILQPFTE